MEKNSTIEEKSVNFFKRLKKKKKIVLCHGAFDIVHPGHIKHFQESKKFGDILVVTITADKFIKKSINNPFFDQQTRLNYLKQLKIVDYCFIVNESTGVTAIETVKPNFYCKGSEYSNLSKDQNLRKELKVLKKNKGKVKYLGSIVKSSSDIISKFLFDTGDHNFQNHLKKIKNINIQSLIEKIKKLKILIIGECILDKYTFVEIKGISPKSNNLSCRKMNTTTMPGGALATYNFLSSLTKNVKLLSIVNAETFNENPRLFNNLKDVIVSKKFTKIVKDRLVEKDNNGSIKKVFTINDFEEKKLDLNDEIRFRKKINENANKADLIIIQDFGHNLFSNKIINALSSHNKKLSINVQTNSLNYGFNIIGKKLKKTKVISLDEKELQLCVGHKDFKHSEELKTLRKKLSADYAFLTRGDKYSMVVDKKNKIITIPKLNSKPIDAMGAGDIFHAMASIMSTISKDSFLNLFIPQISGAHAVEIIGNNSYPKINQIIKTFNFYKNSVNF